jgi:hypothetical protein
MSGGKAFRYVHSGLPADGQDVPGGRSRRWRRRRRCTEVDHAVADGDGIRVGHVTATTCTEARSRTAVTPNTSTAARSEVKMGRKLRWSVITHKYRGSQ